MTASRCGPLASSSGIGAAAVLRSFSVAPHRRGDIFPREYLVTSWIADITAPGVVVAGRVGAHRAWIAGWSSLLLLRWLRRAGLRLPMDGPAKLHRSACGTYDPRRLRPAQADAEWFTPELPCTGRS